MAMVKDLLTRYCEAMHPDNFDKQDELFLQLMDSEPDLEEISQFLKKFEEENGSS
jgi:hypothetical protein